MLMADILFALAPGSTAMKVRLVFLSDKSRDEKRCGDSWKSARAGMVRLDCMERP
jgi:hypothetical protein